MMVYEYVRKNLKLLSTLIQAYVLVLKRIHIAMEIEYGYRVFHNIKVREMMESV